MVRGTFNHKKLTPEEYSGYKIYTMKVTQKYGYKRWDEYLIKIIDKYDGTVLHQGQANINFGVYSDNPTKEDVVQAAHKFIDSNLQNKKTQKVKVGDIFYTSWGYDQTNYDYIIVTGVSPTGKTATCRRTSHKTVGHTQQAHKQVPIAQPFGETFRMKVDYYRGVVGLRGSYPFLHTGEGSKRFGSFSKQEKDQVHYETDSMFGH